MLFVVVVEILKEPGSAIPKSINDSGLHTAFVHRDFGAAHDLARRYAELGHPAKIWQTGPNPVYEIS
jgi:hypothetical protein